MLIVALKKAVMAAALANNESGQLLLLNLDYGSNQDRGAEIAREEAISMAKQLLQQEDEGESNGFFNKFDPRVMSDVIIGLSDGLTVPFALTAGLSLLGNTKLVITGGLAELVSGAISMGLGGFLAARSELEYYHSQVKKEKMEFYKKPELVNQEAAEIMLELGALDLTISLFLRDLDAQPKNLIDFVIRFGKGLEEPAEGREITSALTIGLSYFLGGFVPLFPYFFCNTVGTGLTVSVIVMLITLFIFGYVKTDLLLDDCARGKKILEGIQMVAIGSIAAGSAWTLVYLIDN